MLLICHTLGILRQSLVSRAAVHGVDLNLVRVALQVAGLEIYSISLSKYMVTVNQLKSQTLLRISHMGTSKELMSLRVLSV